MPRNKIILPVNPAVRATAYFSVLIFARTDFFHTRRAFFSRLHATERLFFRFFRPVYLYCFILRFFAFCQPFFITLFSFARSSDAYCKSGFVDNFITPSFTRLSFVLSARFFDLLIITKLYALYVARFFALIKRVFLYVAA